MPGVMPVASFEGGAVPSFVQASTPNHSYFWPQAMESTYADNGIYFGSAAGDGTGQTIAIVDAYNDPTIAGDLAAFDAAYSLPAPPSFSVVNQQGSSNPATLPPVDPAGAGPSVSNWEVEESLDVEWAHAIAPGANIVLVEANSSSLTDLFTAATEGAALGSVVSMSFSTTGSNGEPAEFSGETGFDSDFQVPGVTFLAATGDDGSPGGYPAYSPDVVAVGGTVPIPHAGTFTWASESAWSGSGGGTSAYETEPAYQDNVQSTGQRTIPDVAMDAGVGVWTYDSYNDTNSSGNWFGGVGGTSLATPMWAGLVSIADQGLVAAGQSTLTAYNQTLPALYSAPSSDFHDITSGSNGGYSAGTGYDEVTGIGTPIINELVPDLVAYGNGTQLAVTTQPPGSVTPGTPFGLTVADEDSAGVIDTSFNGTVTLSLGSNPGGSTLGGTLTATAVDGVATFSNLTLNNGVAGYTLQATAGGLSTATTSPFNVTGNAPSVFASGNTAHYTAGGPAVAVDSGLTVSSQDADLTGASMQITNVQAGDTLNFTSQNHITGSYSSGTLTLSGSATLAQYQTALDSVTFSNATNSSTVARSITVVVDDSLATPTTSNPAAETIDVSAPATVTALYVKGTAWQSSFNNYLASHSLGNALTPSLGYALQTGVNQSQDLPWVNVNVIEATFSEQVNVTQSSLVLSGSSAAGYSTPSVTGFSSLGGNTYAWTLSTSLTANRLEISFLSTGSGAVTDTNGAGLSGNWTNGTSSFPSGNGLAGTGTSGDFNFLFNALPGDAARNGQSVNSTDYLDVIAKVNQSTSSSNYTPYYDVLGTGTINTTSYLDVRARVNDTQAPSSTAPGPQDSQVGGLQTTGDDADLAGGMLAVLEGSTTSSSAGSTIGVASNQISGGGSASTNGTSLGSGATGGSGGSVASPPASGPKLDRPGNRPGTVGLRPGRGVGLIDAARQLALNRLEQGQGRREAVQKVLPADGANFAVGEKPSQRNLAQRVVDRGGQSWSGCENSRVPRPLQVNNSAPAAAAPPSLAVTKS